MFIGIPWAFKVKTYRTISPAILLAVPERERKKTYLPFYTLNKLLKFIRILVS